MFKSNPIWRDIFPSFDSFVVFLSWVNVHEHTVSSELSIAEFKNRVENVIHHCSSYQNPKYMIDKMDYIGRVETIEDDLDEISKILGTKGIKTRHLNRKKSKFNYQSYYSDCSYELVSKIYKKDIERFEYKF